MRGRMVKQLAWDLHDTLPAATVKETTTTIVEQQEQAGSAGSRREQARVEQ